MDCCGPVTVHYLPYYTDIRLDEPPTTRMSFDHSHSANQRWPAGTRNNLVWRAYDRLVTMSQQRSGSADQMTGRNYIRWIIMKEEAINKWFYHSTDGMQNAARILPRGFAKALCIKYSPLIFTTVCSRATDRIIYLFKLLSRDIKNAKY